jgi:hypothetical protein
MLATMLNFGGYRVDRFTPSVNDGENFGFYIRAEGGAPGMYCSKAKRQLYVGLALIYQANLLCSLAGIYLDINVSAELRRPAYVELKQDIRAGIFHRVMILEADALLENQTAEDDWMEFSHSTHGVELFTFVDGERIVLPCREKLLSEVA